MKRGNGEEKTCERPDPKGKKKDIHRELGMEQ
jgi:hypothetical protein